MADPALLLLDEVILGLSPKIREEIYKKVLEIKERGTSLFWSMKTLMSLKN